MAKKRRKKSKPNVKIQKKQRGSLPKSRTRLLTNKWINIDFETTVKPNKRNAIHAIHERLVKNPPVKYYRKARRRRNFLRSPLFGTAIALKTKI